MLSCFSILAVKAEWGSGHVCDLEVAFYHCITASSLLETRTGETLRLSAETVWLLPLWKIGRKERRGGVQGPGMMLL